MLSESKLYRGRHYGIAITHIHVESEIAELRETESKQGLQGLGAEQSEDAGQRFQTSTQGMSTFWGSSAQPGDYS